MRKGKSPLSEVAAIILAAGKSTRMKSDQPKVLHEICGKPMLGFVLSACRLAGVDRLVVVVGHGKDAVIERFADQPDVQWVEQKEQRGTGHAVQCCQKALSDFRGSVLVIAGDMPLLRRNTLASLLESRDQKDDGATIATTTIENPTGYGRIIRDRDDNLEAIVEERDCTDEQRKINEVNPSYYCFDAELLFNALDQVRPADGNGEFYLTDAIRILREQGKRVSASVRIAAEEATGINSRIDLACVNRMMQDRLQRYLLDDGVTIIDPDNTWIEADVTVGRESVIHPFSFIGAGATIAEDCKIGPFAYVGADENITAGSVVGPVTGFGVEAGLS